MALNNNQKKIREACVRDLNLAGAQLSDEYYYDSLPLCLVDAVFSIGVRYSSTSKTVERLCENLNLTRINPTTHAQADTYTISNFIDDIEAYEDYGKSELYCNKQRTSTKNGIAKAEAVYKEAKVLKDHGINTLADLHKADTKSINAVAEDWIKVPGQHSGISFTYFLMLAGNDNYFKIDRWLIRFCEKATGEKYDAGNVEPVEKDLLAVCEDLKRDYPNLTPRLLDHEIWGKMSRSK